MSKYKCIQKNLKNIQGKSYKNGCGPFVTMVIDGTKGHLLIEADSFI